MAVSAPTQFVAQRMRELRRRREWSADRLVEELAKHGVDWNRGVVTKLETGRRESVSVAELLGLASAFEVSPLALLPQAEWRGTERKLGPLDEPQDSGAVVAVNWGDYRTQELWTRSGSNFGAWYLLGGEYGRALDDGIPKPPQHPHWEDVLARGPVTLLVPGEQDTYRAGWRNGRRQMVEQMETVSYDEPGEFGSDE